VVVFWNSILSLFIDTPNPEEPLKSLLPMIHILHDVSFVVPHGHVEEHEPQQVMHSCDQVGTASLALYKENHVPVYGCL
jgi:hypothetical protein